MLSVKNHLVLTILVLFNAFTAFGGDKTRCATTEFFYKKAETDPNVLVRKQQFEDAIQQRIIQNSHNRPNETQSIITIPVVVHVVYHENIENISDEQIQSQIDVLNKDFRNLNTDKLPSSHPFYPLASDIGVEFCLAKIDTNGNATTGITRTYTDVTEFWFDEDVKSVEWGGTNPWNATQYLNIWVCNLDDNLLGVATLPSELFSRPEWDGVVINYTAFGTIGTVSAPYDKGRTATHEIGHWLGLRHIWGDFTGCSDSDGIDDTPNQLKSTSDCPIDVVTDACTTTAPGIMYQNYMDYTDDACMVMFTNGQKAIMMDVLEFTRTDIATSNKCSGTTGVNAQTNRPLRIYPNPVQNYITIEGLPKNRNKFYTVDIFNTIGQIVYNNTISTDDVLLEMAGFKTGTYMMKIYNEEFSTTQKLTVLK